MARHKSIDSKELQNRLAWKSLLRTVIDGAPEITAKKLAAETEACLRQSGRDEAVSGNDIAKWRAEGSEQDMRVPGSADLVLALVMALDRLGAWRSPEKRWQKASQARSLVELLGYKSRDVHEAIQAEHQEDVDVRRDCLVDQWLSRQFAIELTVSRFVENLQVVQNPRARDRFVTFLLDKGKFLSVTVDSQHVAGSSPELMAANTLPHLFQGDLRALLMIMRQDGLEDNRTARLLDAMKRHLRFGTLAKPYTPDGLTDDVDVLVYKFCQQDTRVLVSANGDYSSREEIPAWWYASLSDSLLQSERFAFEQHDRELLWPEMTEPVDQLGIMTPADTLELVRWVIKLSHTMAFYRIDPAISSPTEFRRRLEGPPARELPVLVKVTASQEYEEEEHRNDDS